MFLKIMTIITKKGKKKIKYISVLLKNCNYTLIVTFRLFKSDMYIDHGNTYDLDYCMEP